MSIVEREFKYVLELSADLEDQLKENIEALNITVYNIFQGYLGEEGRLRKRTMTHKSGIAVHANPDHIFTYKKKMTKMPGCIEIEHNLKSDDFRFAWDNEAYNKINKTRYVLRSFQGLTWEIDFFKDGQGTYFAMAECEVDQDIKEIDLHWFVEQNLIMRVEENDLRFTNKNLCNRTQTLQLLDQISKGTLYEQVQA